MEGLFGAVKRFFTGASPGDDSRQADGGTPPPPRQRQRLAPVVADAPAGDGGVQGLGWLSGSSLVDADGDVAQAFLEEEPGGGTRQDPPLQASRARLSPAGPASAVVSRGDVTVVRTPGRGA